MAKKSSRKRKSGSATRRGSRPVTSSSGGGAPRWLLWGLIGLGVVLVLALAAVGYASTQKNKVPAQPSAPIEEEIGQPVEGRSIGDPNAPVLVETYEDFLCPHCAAFTSSVGPELMKLVKEGKVRWEFKYRVIFGADAYNADMAAECAADQNKFWEFHDALFRRISEDGKIAVLPKNLKALAAELGLDSAEFNQCLDSKKHLQAIQKEDRLAAARGVNGTPTIFINGQVYQGSFDAESFRAAVEAAAGQE